MGWSLYIIDTRLHCAFMKTASWWLSLVASWMTVLLCFSGASGGSTLFTLGNPYIMEIQRCLIVCVDMSIPVFWLRCALQPFVLKTLSQAYSLVRINPREVGWLSSFFSLWVKKYKWFHWKPFFCGLQYSAGLLELFHGQAISFGNTVWAMFLDEYPWRSRVALNHEVELLRCMCKGCSYIKA